jgi:hypothetical protein
MARNTAVDLLQGTLDMLVLKAVSLGPLHGYGVLLRIQQISQDRLEVQQGSLYPAGNLRGCGHGVSSGSAGGQLDPGATGSGSGSHPSFATRVARPFALALRRRAHRTLFIGSH